ncbi:hypothetical protein FDENT_2965 [Fusarium denticulatum]|uniref:NACHT domain-containing protein n=1 Tax=Fusarium denticulatum TaxID=48507 RepID=A0A8H6CUB4_9HYPO|nr:hypothetical protein FDENT_2965 [Fusarium denticulatum]
MDPFTAIGLAGNILTFVDIGLRLVSQTKGIYDSKSNSTAENDSLSVMTTRFTTTMNDMRSKIPSGNLSKDEKALEELVTECSGISDELQNLLAELKAKKPNSIRSSMKAALRDWSKKKEKDDLQKRLESSRQQLDLLLSTMTRFESLERLNQLVKYGQSNEAEFTSLRRNIDALRSGLQAKILSREALEQIRNVVSLSDRATLKVRESCILTALRFELMDERYDDVAEAHDKTFEWIFASSNSDNNSDDDDHLLHSSNITSYKPMEESGARDNFVDWIKHGNGIFHISGKPGSGKSTLMKYLCRQEETKQYLDIWAADKSLVFGKFFFWNPGTTLQKSLRGLIRGLLYAILSNAPELIPLAFPKHWDVTLSKVAVTFDSSDDIMHAFTDLIRRDEVYRNHKLVFFIDGLDEFQGDHAALINELLRWTSTRPTGVKMCVSSREWPIFQEAFKTFACFRLHELTRSDVSRIVRDRLKKNNTYQKLADSYELAQFESNLVDRSDGVFLWLKLILQDIEDGLLSGDRLSQLQNKVNALPTELNDLFQHLLSSIHPCDRKEAYLILAVALECPPDWPIFRISFLEEYIENRDFAFSQRIKQLEEDQIIDRLERTRKKIYGKCKGLLEIQLVTYPRQSPSIDRTLKESVKFTHRSIIEFLESDQTKQKVAAELKGLDILDAICQTFLAHIQAVIMDKHYYQDRHGASNLDDHLAFPWGDLVHVLPPPSLDYDFCTLLGAYAAKNGATDSSRFTAFLDNVVEVAEDLFSHPAQFQFVDLNWIRSVLIYHTIQASFAVKMGLLTASYGISDYVLQTHLIGLDGVREHMALPMLLQAICQGAQYDNTAIHSISRGLTPIANAYLDLGCDPNGPSAVEGISCWHYMLMRCIFAHSRGPYVPVIASFLLHGANQRFWMKFDTRHRCKDEDDPPTVSIPVEFEWGENRQRLDYLDENSVMAAELDWPLRMFLRKGQVELSCKELLGMMFSQQKSDFEEAVDYILHWDTEILTNDQLHELKERLQPALGSWINSGGSEFVVIKMIDANQSVKAADSGVHDKDATVPKDPGDEVPRHSDGNGSPAHEGDESDEPQQPPLHKKLLEIAEAEQPTKAATLKEFKALLVKKASEINALDRDGKTVLHIAIEQGLTTEAQCIIDGKADIAIADSEGKQPLYLACEEGHTELVELLLSKGASINAASNRNETPLAVACQNGYTKIVNILLHHKADTKTSDEQNWTPLHLASLTNHKEAVKLLLEVDTSNINSTTAFSGWTPLAVAAYFGRKEVVSLLLKKNADVYITNRLKWTPLIAATTGNYPEVVRSILAHKSSWEKPYLEMRDDENNTSLHIAIKEGFYEIANQLVGDGADRAATDSQGMTPLHLASLHNHSKIVALLLSETSAPVVDVDAKADDGRTSLHLASLRGNELIVEALFQKKASIDARDKTGMTPLHLASGASAEDRCRSDRDPVSPGPSSDNDPEREEGNSEAKSEQYLQVVEFLLRNGADASIKASNGHTALHCAAESGDEARIGAILKEMKADEFSWRDWKDSPIHSALGGDDPLTAMKLLLAKQEMMKAPFWENDGRSQVIKEVFEHTELRDILPSVIGEVPKERQKLPKGSESWDVIQWAAYMRIPRELSELIDLARSDEEVNERVHEALWMTCDSIIAEGLESEASCESLIQVFVTLITNSTKTPQNTKVVKKASDHVENLISPAEAGDQQGGKKVNQRQEQLSTPKRHRGSTSVVIDRNISSTKGLKTEINRATKVPTIFSTLQDILKDPPFDLISRTYKDKSNYKLPVTGSTHEGIVGKAQATVVGFFKGETESGTIRRNRTVKNIVYGPGPTEVVREAIGSLNDMAKRYIMHFNSKLYAEGNLKLTWVHLPSTNMTWMNVRILVPPIVDHRENSTIWVVVPDKESHSRMMRPQSVIRPEEAGRGDSGTGQESKKDPTKAEAAVPESTGGEQKHHDDWNSAEKKYQFVPASALYMPYLAYSSHCGVVGGIKDTKLKKAHEAYEELLESYNGKNEQQHGSPTLDEWYYQFAQDDKEAIDDQRERNKNQVVSKYLKENEDGSRASKLHQWTVVRVNQLWIWTVADNWIITSTSSPLDDSPDALVDDILNLLSNQAEYGGSRAQPVSAAELVPVIVDHCIGSYDRRPNYAGRISIGQTFSHYINRIGRDETNLFNDFRTGSSDELQRKNVNSELRTHSPVAEKQVAEAAIADTKTDTVETKQPSLKPHDHDFGAAIQRAKNLCFYIKDVRDELSILKSVAGYQQIVQNGLGDKAVDESQLSSTYVLKNLKELDDIAERIQSAINTTLSLQQSEEATRQGKTVMTFTFATVLFLPLSFLSSLFALDVNTFQEAPAWVFYIIFFVSIGISAILGFSVFYWDNITSANKMLFDIVKRPFKVNSSPASLPSKFPEKEGTGGIETGRRDSAISIPSKSKDGELGIMSRFRGNRRKNYTDDLENRGARG